MGVLDPLRPSWRATVHAIQSSRPRRRSDAASSILSRVNAERSPRLCAARRAALTTPSRFREQNVLLFIGVQNIDESPEFCRRCPGIDETTASRFDDQLGIFPLIGLDWRF
jgi:hypothetical protein